jgi:hypothetical protein
LHSSTAILASTAPGTDPRGIVVPEATQPQPNATLARFHTAGPVAAGRRPRDYWRRAVNVYAPVFVFVSAVL